MAQYQSFPGVAGDSRTQDKLKALKLPDLAGRSFLDVGCNEGYFCGFAKFLGASRAVGLDHSELFIERARQRFPECEFRQQAWDQLPEEKFDVVLLASALHYAEDQAGLVHRLMDVLSPGGVLVLELGIASSPENAWVEVERGIDRRRFPTMEKLREILDDYAWKWMGKSVLQDGDPVARHVVHVSRRRSIAYLLMQPPAYGKTSIAARLFAPAGVPVVSGDLQIALVAQDKIPAPERLRKAIKRDYSPFRIDQTIQRIFDSGAGAELVHLWVGQAGEGDFALDAYVPMDHHARVEETIAALGYLPVQLRWDRTGPALLPAVTIDERAHEFHGTLGELHAPRPTASRGQATGFVDQLLLEDGNLVIRGWAVNAVGELPEHIGVRFNGRTFDVGAFEKQQRTDVQRHLKLGHAWLGFRATLRIPGVVALENLGKGFEVFVPDEGIIRLAKNVIRQLGGKP